MTCWEKRYKLLTTVHPVLSGHLWEKEKGFFKTSDPLKEAQFIWNFLWQQKTDLTTVKPVLRGHL